MLHVEQALTERLPWLAQHPMIRRPVAGMLGRLADESGFNRVLDRIGNAEGFAFAEKALDVLGCSYHVLQRERENIPVEGGVLIVANHPLGMLDAMALVDLVGSVRQDARIMGNDFLKAIPQLGELLLPVDVFGSGAASRLRNVYRALERGEALIVFPAGEVSRMGPAGVRDGRWSDGFARLAMHSKVPVLPIHVAARNSAIFYGLSMLAKPLSTAMLPREAVATNVSRIGFSVGALISPEELEKRSGGSSQRAANLMRRHVYRLARRRGLIFGGQVPLAHPEPVDRVAMELGQCEKLADLSDGKQLLVLRGSVDGAALREIGRLRELTFRKVGEGTNTRRDLDAYDAHYEHLVLWDPKALRIVGSYRLGYGGRLINEQGMAGLYTSSLFQYSPALESRLAQGLELGRSFVAPAYWRSRALDQLWQGIGLYLQRHRDLRYLFGPVSMSVNLPRQAREWIAAAHQHYFGAPGLAAARQPFKVSPDVLEGVRRELEGLDPVSGLGRLRNHLDALGVSLPVLYRQYVDLVEPDGVQFLDFGEDPGFSGCVDGLVMLDLSRLKPAKRARYLGKGA
ncbi:lysophospholipid acyltransferase family protein [Dyella psychrodurans]|uniref:L-ornithine N(alpha)-acyltransferase n=1 Tax=Dyella psychrodurans TaxID=1927960 RepID=A0A370XA69_9GAMM|nr:lysophospholipid acyltransferase family protein [Dyella psychrodurans]RDS85333.1 GNAT family N-acetyltransferase [Dyella psychrodurans]